MMRGFRLGTAIADVKTLLKVQFGVEEVEAFLNNVPMGDEMLICTNAQLNIGGASYTTIIMGDVNGDGVVDNIDLLAIKDHVDNKALLEGVFLKAADVTASFGGKVDQKAADIVEYYLGGHVAIAQFEPGRTGVYDDKIAEVYAKNPDVVGWITIPGTNIDYPIMFDKTGKWYYNYHTVEREQADRGSIYAYYPWLTHQNVVTGHNSRPSQQMFHALHHVQEYNNGKSNCAYANCNLALTDVLPDLNKYAERVWTITLYGVESKWEVFAMYETKAGVKIEETLYDNIWWPGKGKSDYSKDSDAKIQTWIDKQLANSEIKIETNVSVNDTFLTLFTCGNEKADADRNARLYFFLKKVD